MKKIINSISRIITILIIFSVIDVISIYKDSKPVFLLKTEVNDLNKKYAGLLFDTYNCASYNKPQIKMKWTKYECPLSNKEENIDNNNFIYIHPKTTALTPYEKTHTLIFSPEFSSLPNWIRRINEPHNKVTKQIFNYFIRDKIFYSSNDVGEIVRNYLLWCRKSDI